MSSSFQYQIVPTDQLELDTTNPRIRKWIEIYGENPTAEQIHLALGVGGSDTEINSTTFTSLRESIRSNKGIINPIIVNRRPDGKMVVIEGNTRLAIFRGFADDKVPGPWENIPALVHDDLAQLGIDAIRLQAHLVGPRPWDAYSKAKYLHHLRNQENLPFNQLVDLCGGKRRELQDYIDAYSDMEKYYRHVVQDDGTFDPTRFSAFVELQKPAVKQAILKAGHDLNDFAEWVNERLIDPLNTVRLLPRILENPRAREIFLQDGAKEAIKVLDAPATTSAQALTLDELARAFAQRINQLPWRDLERLRENSSLPLAQAFFEAEDALNEVCRKIRDEEN
jgi:hypothetical protein